MELDQTIVYTNQIARLPYHEEIQRYGSAHITPFRSLSSAF